MATIRLDIEKSFKNLNLHFQFSTSENRVILFGPSGSGKSVLLKMIAGFFDPDNGEMRISDRVFFNRAQEINVPTHLRHIGYLPQEYTLFPNMTVEENIIYGLKTQKLSVEPQFYRDLIDRFDLGSKLSSYPKALSGGQQQRAALARILLIQPQLLLLDEPFSALDSSIRESLRDLVIDLTDELGIPVLFVTHDIEEAFVFGQEVVIIKNGRVLESGPKSQIFDHPNFVETAHLVGFENVWPVLQIETGRARIDENLSISYQGRADKAARYLCIRPENVMILKADQPYKKIFKENILDGSVAGIHARGLYMKVEFELDKETVESGRRLVISIHIPVHAFVKLGLVVGKPIKVSLKEESVVLCKIRYPE